MPAVDSPTLAGAMTWPQAAHQPAHQDPLASSMDDDPACSARGVGTPDTGRDSPTGGHHPPHQPGADQTHVPP
ncbi:hypothetical protein TCAL_14775 [Tigriopus californicus]|uniref:Uncharacterized protein n=1 Tax=Tigriopus californicus TaxID=6832 RepID=A0A553PIH6_TIGCA|nr:hypothetical protein TCAL_14775 [Tigriopus californicus]